ncbi:MAG: hypothetical protein GC136_09645 [Alphaproteobacteria bacterium]|nr:hypothetical protein [Alphaproteobacteria bacterium]
MTATQNANQLFVEFATLGPEHEYESVENSDIQDLKIPDNVAYFCFCQFVDGIPVRVSPTYFLTSDHGTLTELKESFPSLVPQIEEKQEADSDEEVKFMVVHFPDSPTSDMVWPVFPGVVLIDRETRDVVYSSISPTATAQPAPQP